MINIIPFKGTRPFNEDAKNLIAPSTDHLSIENIEIFKKSNYWNYLKILNPVGQLKEKDSLSSIEKISCIKSNGNNIITKQEKLDSKIEQKSNNCIVLITKAQIVNNGIFNYVFEIN